MAEAIDHTFPSAVPTETTYIGRGLDRKDGPLKVTGGAKYAAEFPVARIAHAVAFCSTICRGTVTNIDSSAAERLPGVLAVITHKNAQRMQLAQRSAQMLLPMQDDSVHFAGQYLGLVVAETLEQATAAADLVRISYNEQKFNLDPGNPLQLDDRLQYSRGDADAQVASSPVKIQQTYSTPNEFHNPMEMHATIAEWQGNQLTLWDATQGVINVRSIVAETLGINGELVRVINPFVGGGFGCKGSVWPNSYLAAVAAKQVGRPVKFMLTRKQMFSQAGYRPSTNQKISIGADAQGQIIAITHDGICQTSDFQDWVENSPAVTPVLYAAPNVRTSQRLARINAGTPTQMRAPGEATGVYALEVAMDELAVALKMDPIELRLKNYAETDLSSGRPFTSKSLRECYKAGADKFGWSRRNPEPRSMKDGHDLIGWGMASATYPAAQWSSAAAVRLLPDLSVVVSAAGADLGTGTYTIMAQIAAETLGIAPEKIRVELGDTDFPRAPVAGGSTHAVTVGSAVRAAAEALIRNIAHFAMNDSGSPLHGKDLQQISAVDGFLVFGGNPSVREPLGAVLGRNGGRAISATAETGQSPNMRRYSGYSYGAQFVEVRVDAAFGIARVTRHVAAIGAGRILNAKTARSQIMGGMVMGIGMALYEEGIYEPNRGYVVNNNLADYLVPVNADIRDLDVIFVDEKDTLINALGAKGVGELGITGVAAAVVNAVYHATGKRVRDLPIRCEDLMDA